MELYYLNLSQPSRAVYATIKHLGLPVTIKKTDLFGGEHRTDKFLKLNPAHQVPVLDDNGLILTESRAIMAYLVNQYSPNHSIYPSDPKIRAKIDRMLFFEAATFMPTLRVVYVSRLFKRVEPTEEDMQAVRNVISELLALKGENKFLAGSEVSLADISLAMIHSCVDLWFPEEIKPLKQWYKDVEEAVPAVKELNAEINFSAYDEMLKKMFGKK